MSSLYSIFHSNFPIDVAFTSKPQKKSNFEIFLESLDYKTWFISSISANYRSFQAQKTILVKPQHAYNSTALILNKTLSILQNNSKNCILAYIFNTHFNYYYPPAFKKYMPTSASDTNPLFLEPTNTNIQKNKNRYLNAVSYTDYCLGIFFKQIKNLHLDKNTIFVIFGDHGESLGESGFFAHATGPHKVQFHTPLIIFGSSIHKKLITYPTCHIDIIPTLADIMNFNISNTHGISLNKPQKFPLLNLDESVSGRIVVRRQNSMSLFDIKRNKQLKWLATLNNDYSLRKNTLSLYNVSGLSKLATRIDQDANFIIKRIANCNSN